MRTFKEIYESISKDKIKKWNIVKKLADDKGLEIIGSMGQYSVRGKDQGVHDFALYNSKSVDEIEKFVKSYKK